MVEYSYDADDRFDRFRDDRRDEMRREQMIMDAMRELERETRRLEPPIRQERESQFEFYQRTMPGTFDEMGNRLIAEVINNPDIKMTKSQKEAVNDKKKVMNRNGRIVKAQSGRDAIRSSGQFRNTGIPLPPVKRTRRKTKMDKTMSTCLKIANKRMRKKNGQLRKGKTMRDVMKLAHRLCKKS
jgi:hypothetical protein